MQPTAAKLPELAEIHINNDGMIAEHNFPCPVCQKIHAVLNCNSGVFSPCWECQEKQWFTIQINSRFLRWLLGIGK